MTTKKRTSLGPPAPIPTHVAAALAASSPARMTKTDTDLAALYNSILAGIGQITEQAKQGAEQASILLPRIAELGPARGEVAKLFVDRLVEWRPWRQYSPFMWRYQSELEDIAFAPSNRGLPTMEHQQPTAATL